MKTKLTEALDLRLPIIQAPMGGGIAGAELAAAVCNAGGLGLLPIWPMSPDVAAGEIEALRRATPKPFGVNLNVAFDPSAHLELALAHDVGVIHFFWGDAAPFIARAKTKGARVMATVGSAAEARRACDAGVDILVAQGVEAGGHVWGKTGLVALLPEITAVSGGRPVAAAGGIVDGRSLAAALMLGATGAVVGTALIVADESGAHPGYKQALIDTASDETVLGTAFDVGWPGAPCRVLRNSTIRTWEKAGSPASGQRPGEGETVSTVRGQSVPRYSVVPPTRDTQGEIEAMALYAGQGVGRVDRCAPAATILSTMVRDAEVLLGKQ